MLVTMPASVAFKNHPWRTGVSGTLWNGEVGIAGGSTLRWRFAPLRSLTSLGFAADWHATGPNTDLGGRMLMRPGRVVLDEVGGAADASLLRLMGARLPFSCDFAMQVQMERIALGGSGQMMQGNAVTDPGNCRTTGGAATPVPALYFDARAIGSESRIRLTPATQRRNTLVSAVLSESGAMEISATRDGATTLPFLGIPPGASIQTQF
ncbi:type II secretion system protein N [Stakelama tenebrarum]|uniref:Type II secretion system protein N n=1 Tax=Stakelama tenebrarum TaxID=2711215 RepID=A0A6G6Y594_9SPHN|nr:type II secretion system protein N [Sphingosinithalassobacter tenebrarum]QIG79746.1 type II secretion system protein N [Sphingosinithalassobacter tenebrarum]